MKEVTSKDTIDHELFAPPIRDLQEQLNTLTKAVDLLIANQNILKEFVQAIATDVYKEKKIIVPS